MFLILQYLSHICNTVTENVENLNLYLILPYIRTPKLGLNKVAIIFGYLSLSLSLSPPPPLPRRLSMILSLNQIIKVSLSAPLHEGGPLI